MPEKKAARGPGSPPARDPWEEIASTPPPSQGDGEEDLNSWLISCLQAVY